MSPFVVRALQPEAPATLAAAASQRRATRDPQGGLELGLDRQRAGGWAFVQTLAWSIDTVVWAEMIEVARWLRDAYRRA